jgi:hypothetical protein
MSSTEAVAAQLTGELGGVARAIGDVLGVDLLLDMETRLEPACRRLAAELCSGDDHLAAEAVLTVMTARWPEGTDPPPEWWHTPVGRMVARSVGRDDAEAVTHSVAAAMLGLHRGTVAQLVYRGTLDRHPDGGITRASVLARLARGQA